MCISPPSTPATSTRAPTQTTAQNLELGTSVIQRNQATVLGRLALTAPKKPTVAPAGSPGSGTTTATPAGTLGLAPGAGVTPGPGGTKNYTPFSTGYNR